MADKIRREGNQVTTHNREIDHKAAEKVSPGGLSANFVELLKGHELSKGGDRIAQSGDVLSFSDQVFSNKHGGYDFLSKPVTDFKINQTAFLEPTTFKPSAAVRLDGKPL